MVNGVARIMPPIISTETAAKPSFPNSLMISINPASDVIRFINSFRFSLDIAPGKILSPIYQERKYCKKKVRGLLTITLDKREDILLALKGKENVIIRIV